MARNRLTYGLLLIAALLFSQFMWDRISAVTLVAVALLPILSFLLLVLSAWGVTAELASAPAVIERYQAWDGAILLQNKGILPLTQMRLSGMLPNDEGDGLDGKRLVLSLSPRKQMRLNLHMRCPYRGVYELSLDLLELYDPLRLFCIRKRLNRRMKLLVVPRRLLIGPLPTSRVPEDQADADLGVKGQERTELSAVREYRDGDLLKDVHWKLTAKADGMLVKLYDENTRDSAFIAVDLSAYYDSAALCHGVVDASVEAALAVCRRLMDDGAESLLLWRDSDAGLQRRKVSTVPEYEQALYDLAAVRMAVPPSPPEDVLSEAAAELQAAGAVFVATSGVRDELVRALVSCAAMTTAQVHLLYVDAGLQDADDLALSLQGTAVRLWRLDPETLSASLDNAAQAARG